MKLADERIQLGDIMKRVSLGFFNKNNMGELSAAATTDLSLMEMYAMNMINTVVNGYITVIVLILFLAFTVRLRVLSHWLEFCSLHSFCTCWKSKAGKMQPVHQKAQDDMVESSIEYLRGMQIVKPLSKKASRLRGFKRLIVTVKKINIKIELEYMPLTAYTYFP